MKAFTVKHWHESDTSIITGSDMMHQLTTLPLPVVRSAPVPRRPWWSQDSISARRLRQTPQKLVSISNSRAASAPSFSQAELSEGLGETQRPRTVGTMSASGASLGLDVGLSETEQPKTMSAKSACGLSLGSERGLGETARPKTGGAKFTSGLSLGLDRGPGESERPKTMSTKSAHGGFGLDNVLSETERPRTLSTKSVYDRKSSYAKGRVGKVKGNSEWSRSLSQHSRPPSNEQLMAPFVDLMSRDGRIRYMVVPSGTAFYCTGGGALAGERAALSKRFKAFSESIHW